jgi:NAD(P)-dependent dehydrogenase (short-subunit alcohol dehydrogenase family)
MSADCGVELAEHNVTVLSLWPGAVKTEHFHALRKDDKLAEMAKVDLLFNLKKKISTN